MDYHAPRYNRFSFMLEMNHSTYCYTTNRIINVQAEELPHPQHTFSFNKWFQCHPNPPGIVLLGPGYTLVIPVHVWTSVYGQFRAYPTVSRTFTPYSILGMQTDQYTLDDTSGSIILPVLDRPCTAPRLRFPLFTNPQINSTFMTPSVEWLTYYGQLPHLEWTLS